MCVCVCVCVVVYINVCRMGEEARASHCSALPRGNFPAATLPRPLCERAKNDKIVLSSSNHIPIPRLLSLFILVSNTAT